MEFSVIMCTGNWIKLYALVAGLFLLLVTLSPGVYAEEIAAYKLTEIEGYVGLRYRYDGDLTQQVSGPKSKETRSIFEEEVHILSHGYVYHPNLLKVDLGAGILFNQEELQTVSGSAEHDDTLYELNARLIFLEEKPYPLTLFYDKSHPSVALNVTDVFVQENEKYGMNFSLRQPVSPVTLNYEAYKQSTNGNSFTQIVDNTNTYQTLNANTNLKNGGYASLSYTKNRQKSMSGSKSLPIQPFNVTTKTTDLNTRLIFGKQRNINFNLIATQTTQTQDRDLKELRVSPYLTWQHSKDFNSYYRYSLLEREQSSFKSQDSSIATGLNYKWNKNLYSNAELHFNENKATGLKLNNIGVSGSVTYEHKLAIGLLQFNVGLNYDNYDRVVTSQSSLVTVTDADYTLSGTTSVTLALAYIDILSIVVKRKDTNEVLTKDVDYVVVEITDKQTQIQKINPALPASLDVLVTYDYDPGGSAAYNSLGQSYRTSLQFNDYFTAYLKYRDRQHNLKSGLPTLSLNSSDTSSYGLRVNYPFPTDIDLTVGGEIFSEEHNENISSYEKSSADIFMKVAFPYSSNLHLSMRRLQVDNLFSSEDVDLTGYMLRLRSSPAHRLTLLLQLSNDKNTGGSIPSQNRNISLTGQWRIRKLRLEFGVRKVTDTQSLIKHERTVFNVTLRRDF